MPSSLDKLIPEPEKRMSDWTISISLPPETIFGPKHRLHFWRYSLVDGSAQDEIKVFENLDLYSSIRNFVHFGVLTPAEIPDLRDLLEVTRHLKAAIAT